MGLDRFLQSSLNFTELGLEFASVSNKASIKLHKIVVHIQIYLHTNTHTERERERNWSSVEVPLGEEDAEEATTEKVKGKEEEESLEERIDMAIGNRASQREDFTRFVLRHK